MQEFYMHMQDTLLKRLDRLVRTHHYHADRMDQTARRIIRHGIRATYWDCMRYGANEDAEALMKKYPSALNFI